MRFALDKPAEADALHAPAHEETTSLGWIFRGAHALGTISDC
jgi:hypothetical protein